MSTRILFILMLLGLSCFSHAACPPQGMSRAGLSTLKQNQWKIADTAQRQQQALSLAACLADPDPYLRDEVAFEALSFWMRGQQLEVATVRTLYQQLMDRLAQPADAQGFALPFAALALAEVARVDRLQPFLNPAERKALLANATNYLQQIKDYRAYETQGGWRHGVAHGADLLLQLALNPALERAQHERLLSAIASQLAPAAHAYQYGESARLAAPVFYLARRASLDAGDWEMWLNSVTAVTTTAPDRATSMQETFIRAHNLRAFLHALYFMLQENGDPLQKQKLLSAVTTALKQLR